MTPDQARDEMLAVFKAAWDTTGFVAVYSDVPGTAPTSEQAWARVSVRHATGGQTGLSPTTLKRFTQSGTLIVQVFAPVGDGLSKVYELAQLLLLAYSQSRGSVWYRRMRIQEVGNDGAFEQINFITDFTYDDQR